MSEEKSFNENKKFYNYGISQKAIIYNPENLKLLLVKVKEENGYFGKKYGPWELPGGTLTDSEELKKSLDREIKEEIGKIGYEIIGPSSTGIILNSDGKKKLFIGYLVKYLDGEINLSEEHSEYKWVKAEEVEKSDEYKPWLKQFIKKASEYLENKNALNNWKRCQADFENYKKDQAKMMGEFRKFASLDLVMQILPVLDNFEQSLEHVPGNQKDNAWVTGINYIQKQLEDVLKNNGVSEIEVKVGDEFDPAIHEAVDTKETNMDTKTTNKVIKVVQKGYKIDGKIIRAAKVIVN